MKSSHLPTSGYLPSSAPTTVSVISDSTNAVVATLTAGNSNTWDIGAAYDSGKGEVFVSNNVDNTVSVISDSSNTVVATVPVGNDPEPVAYDSGKGEIFVVNWMDSTISVISDSTNKVVATIKMTPALPQLIIAIAWLTLLAKAKCLWRPSRLLMATATVSQSYQTAQTK